MRILGIDPSLRATGICLLEGRRVVQAWTVRYSGDLDTLPGAIAYWVDRETRAILGRCFVELPPPRVQDRKYQVEVGIAAGAWLDALWQAGFRPRLVPAHDWQASILGPSKTWINGDSKEQAKVRCQAEGFEGLHNEHERDAALIALWGSMQIQGGLKT